jgi:hypothetical protein
LIDFFVPFLILRIRGLAILVFLQVTASTHATHRAQPLEVCGPLCKGCAYSRSKHRFVNSDHKILGLSEIYVRYTGTSLLLVRRMIVHVATK